MKKYIRIIVEGRVQGVGFRYFTCNYALKYNITGFVRNTCSGSVEIVCNGVKNDIDAFVNKIKRGPSFSFVSDIKINERSDKEDFDGFEIRY